MAGAAVEEGGRRSVEGEGYGAGLAERADENSVAAAIASRPSSGAGELEPLYRVDRHFFHVDLLDAVDAAVRDAIKRDERRMLQDFH